MKMGKTGALIVNNSVSGTGNLGMSEVPVASTRNSSWMSHAINARVSSPIVKGRTLRKRMLTKVADLG